MNDNAINTNEDALTLDRSEMRKVSAERIQAITKEFSDGFRFLENYPKSITFFGSTKTTEDDPYYESARKLSGRLVRELGYSIVSGGGPGIMEAADRGAYEAGGDSVGLLIKLPDAQPTNPYIKKSISFYYFFARKVCLVFGAEVYIFFPGGFGTLDEFFEIITLLQTKKVTGAPIILFGSDYWGKLKDFIEKEILDRGYISEKDMNLFTITDDHDEVIKIVKNTPIKTNIPFGGAK